MSNQQTSHALALVPDLPENPPRAQRLRLVEPETISSGDESALSWYFGQGLSIYDRSTFGAVLQRITLDGFSSGPCERCDGEGILNDGGFAVSTRCRHCDGKGTVGDTAKQCADCRGSGVVLPYELRAKHGGWCDSCRGTGTTSMSRREQRRKRCVVCRGTRIDSSQEGAHCLVLHGHVTGAVLTRGPAQCRACLGTGYEPTTASPATKADSGSGVMVDDSALTRFAITSRRLVAVREQSPALYEAMECYYGDVGARWAREDFGRMFALYALTPSGKRLARWGEAKLKSEDRLAIAAQERVGVQAVLERTQPKRERTALLVAANQQAQELYQRAVVAWNRAQPGRSDPALKRLAQRFVNAGMVTAGTHLLLHAGGK